MAVYSQNGMREWKKEKETEMKRERETKKEIERQRERVKKINNRSTLQKEGNKIALSHLSHMDMCQHKYVILSYFYT